MAISVSADLSTAPSQSQSGSRAIAYQSAPPGSPAANSTYIVQATGTGAWAGQDNNAAYWNGTAWSFTTVKQWEIWSFEQGSVQMRRRTATGWEDFPAVTSETGHLSPALALVNITANIPNTAAVGHRYVVTTAGTAHASWGTITGGTLAVGDILEYKATNWTIDKAASALKTGDRISIGSTAYHWTGSAWTQLPAGGETGYLPPVISIVTNMTTQAPGIGGLAAAADGQRYIVTAIASPHGNWGTISGLAVNDVIERKSGTWVVSKAASALVPNERCAVGSAEYAWNGTAWSAVPAGEATGLIPPVLAFVANMTTTAPGVGLAAAADGQRYIATAIASPHANWGTIAGLAVNDVIERKSGAWVVDKAANTFTTDDRAVVGESPQRWNGSAWVAIGVHRGDWKTGVVYYATEMAYEAGDYWRCNNTHTSGATRVLNASSWERITKPAGWLAPSLAVVSNMATQYPGTGLAAASNGQRYLVTNITSPHASWGTITGLAVNDIIERKAGVWVVDQAATGLAANVRMSVGADQWRWSGTAWAAVPASEPTGWYSPALALVANMTTSAPGVGLAAAADGQRYVVTAIASPHANWGTITGLAVNDIIERKSGAWVVDKAATALKANDRIAIGVADYRWSGTAWTVITTANLADVQLLGAVERVLYDVTNRAPGVGGLPAAAAGQRYALNSITSPHANWGTISGTLAVGCIIEYSGTAWSVVIEIAKIRTNQRVASNIWEFFWNGSAWYPIDDTSGVLDPVIAIVGANTQAPGVGLAAAAVGQRYVVHTFTGAHANWGTFRGKTPSNNVVAEFDGSEWIIVTGKTGEPAAGQRFFIGSQEYYWEGTLWTQMLTKAGHYAPCLALVDLATQQPGTAPLNTAVTGHRYAISNVGTPMAGWGTISGTAFVGGIIEYSGSAWMVEIPQASMRVGDRCEIAGKVYRYATTPSQGWQDTTVDHTGYLRPVTAVVTNMATQYPGNNLAAAAAGQRYIITNTGSPHASWGTITGLAANDIIEYSGTVWAVAKAASTLRAEDRVIANAVPYRWSGTAWAPAPRGRTINTTTTSYTVLQPDRDAIVRCLTSTGNVAVQLDDQPTLGDNFEVLILKVNSQNTVTINKDAADNFASGETSLTITGENEFLLLRADSSRRWHIIVDGRFKHPKIGVLEPGLALVNLQTQAPGAGLAANAVDQRYAVSNVGTPHANWGTIQDGTSAVGDIIEYRTGAWYIERAASTLVAGHQINLNRQLYEWSGTAWALDEGALTGQIVPVLASVDLQASFPGGGSPALAAAADGQRYIASAIASPNAAWGTITGLAVGDVLERKSGTWVIDKAASTHATGDRADVGGTENRWSGSAWSPVSALSKRTLLTAPGTLAVNNEYLVDTTTAWGSNQAFPNNPSDGDFLRFAEANTDRKSVV